MKQLIIAKILIIGLVAVPAYAIHAQYWPIEVSAQAEDDCAYFLGNHPLDAVEPQGDHVVCRYRP